MEAAVVFVWLPNSAPAYVNDRSPRQDSDAELRPIVPSRL